MGDIVKAKIGDEIICKEHLKGIVEKVNMNSVIVNITSNQTEKEYLGGRTVISHKNYEIL